VIISQLTVFKETLVQISSSSDWPTVEQSMLRHIREVGYNDDLYKLFRNIEKMISELNKAEVEARRIKNLKYLEPKITEINAAIERFEQWAILLILSR
jgi:hypothetical protein